ncbi:MAG TPA: hypothetical protein VFV34_09210 [Blastocatellia bacterium]|nr:hypothetical protein [Blastocatellia bacterium]
MGKLSAVAFGGALLFSNSVTARGQQGIGTAGISGTIAAALKLSVPRDWVAGSQTSTARADVEARSDRDVLIAVGNSGDSQPGQFTIPLEIRGNVAYELRITQIGMAGCAPSVTSSISSATPSGRLVRPAAVAGSVATRDVDLASLQTATRLLAGPRVSLAGDYSSPNNALVANLVINIPAGSTCAWRMTLLVSLQPAGQ